jgi:hypothetical protein
MQTMTITYIKLCLPMYGNRPANVLSKPLKMAGGRLILAVFNTRHLLLIFAGAFAIAAAPKVTESLIQQRPISNGTPSEKRIFKTCSFREICVQKRPLFRNSGNSNVIFCPFTGLWTDCVHT